MRNTTFGLALFMAAGLVPACGQPGTPGNDGDMSPMNKSDGSNPSKDMLMSGGDDLTTNAMSCSMIGKADMPGTMPLEAFACQNVTLYQWLFSPIGEMDQPLDLSSSGCFRIGIDATKTHTANGLWTCSSSDACWQNCGPGHADTCYKMTFRNDCTFLGVDGWSQGLDPAKDQPDRPNLSWARRM
jgi:hypothetical protein